MSCDVGEVTERLENELCCISLYLWALLILQPFRHFTNVTSHSPTLPSLYLHHSSFSNPSVASATSVHSPTLLSFSNPSVASPKSQLILQPFRCLTYVTSFPYPSVTSSTSQLILQPFRCFSYVTAHSPTLPSHLLRHRLFTYVTWRAAHDLKCDNSTTQLTLLWQVKWLLYIFR